MSALKSIKKKEQPSVANPVICRCNSITKNEILCAIKRGCTDIHKIYDATTAGLGPCGGSCRLKIKNLIDSENDK